MTILSDQMEFAVRLARSGEREQARMIFADIVEYRPAEVDAWLWLSELADTLDDQIAALEKAAQYFSSEGENSQTLQERLNQIRGGPALPMPSNETVLKTVQESAPAVKPQSAHSETYQKAERYYLLGDNEKASQLLTGLLEEDPTHEEALKLAGELAAEQEECPPGGLSTNTQKAPRNPLQALTRKLFAR